MAKINKPDIIDIDTLVPYMLKKKFEKSAINKKKTSTTCYSY